MLILGTLHHRAAGEVAITDYMPVGEGQHLVRIVEGRRGAVVVELTLALRFVYGSTRRRVVRTENSEIRILAGSAETVLRCSEEAAQNQGA